MPNEKKYIDVENYCENICHCDNKMCDKVSCPLLNAPAADVAEVVRCKDCRFWTAMQEAENSWGECTRLLDRYVEDSESNFDAKTYWIDYCSCGERKNGDKANAT